MGDKTQEWNSAMNPGTTIARKLLEQAQVNAARNDNPSMQAARRVREVKVQAEVDAVLNILHSGDRAKALSMYNFIKNHAKKASPRGDGYFNEILEKIKGQSDLD